jgi:hypothetical protein
MSRWHQIQVTLCISLVYLPIYKKHQSYHDQKPANQHFPSTLVLGGEAIKESFTDAIFINYRQLEGVDDYHQSIYLRGLRYEF